MTSFELNQDTCVFGRIIRSHCSTPRKITTKGSDVYLVEIEAEEDIGIRLASLWHAYGGSECLNGDDLYNEYVSKRTFVFTSIKKPLTTGADVDTGEFSEWQRVKVSCRFYLEDGEMTHKGIYRWPVLQLRFIDLATDDRDSDDFDFSDSPDDDHFDF